MRLADIILVFRIKPEIFAQVRLTMKGFYLSRLLTSIRLISNVNILLKLDRKLIHQWQTKRKTLGIYIIDEKKKAQAFFMTNPSVNRHEREHLYCFRSPSTPTMNDVFTDSNCNHHESRRCSTPGHSNNQSETNSWRTEPINICTDCFFLLQQIRKKSRQRHVSPAVTSNLVSSSSFSRSHHSNSNYNLSSSLSTSSLAALLVQQQQQQQQRSLMARTTSVHNNLKTVKSAQELSLNNNPLQTLTTLAAAAAAAAVNTPPERVSLSRRHLFLTLQPTYDTKLNNTKTG